MKKTLLFILIAALNLLSPVKSEARSYKSLWRDVKTALDRDLPKTALDKIEKITLKASGENQKTEYVKAFIAKVTLIESIVPDSIERLIAQEESMTEKETDPCLKAIRHSLLGKLHSLHGQRDAMEKARQHYSAAMSSPDILLDKEAKKYIPLVLIGKSSNIIDTSLLWVVGRWCIDGMQRSNLESKVLRDEMFSKMLTAYRKKNLRNACLITELDSISSMTDGKEQTALYEKLTQEYADLPLCVEVYIRLSEDGSLSPKERKEWAQKGLALFPKSKRSHVLRNSLHIITNPFFSVSLPKTTFPLSEDSIRITSRGIRSVAVSLYRLKESARHYYENEITDDFIKKHTSSLPKDKKEFVIPLSENHVVQNNSFAYRSPEKGIYLAKITADGLESSSQILYVSNLFAARQALPKNKVRVIISQADDGRAVKGANIFIFNSDKNKQQCTDTIMTDDKGQAEATIKNGASFFVETASDNFLSKQSLSAYGTFFKENQTRVMRGSIYTDRAVYRPGQKVSFGGIFHFASGDSLTVAKDTEVVIGLKDARRKTIKSDTLRTDSLGVISGCFDLPVASLEGTFSLSSNITSTTFRVASYRRPTFAVKIYSSDSPHHINDTAFIKGEARTYTDRAMAGATVRYEVKREDFFFRHKAQVKGTLSEGETITDSLGFFTIPIPFKADGQENDAVPYPFGGSYFVARAYVVSSDGETQKGEKSFYLGKQHKFLSIQGEEIVCREQLKKTTISCNNYDGEEVKEKGFFYILRGTDIIERDTFITGTEFVINQFRSLPSGTYKLKVMLSSDTTAVAEKEFSTFSLEDTRPFGKKGVQVYQSSNEFEGKGSVNVCISIPKDVTTLFYDLFSNGRRIKSSVISASDTIVTFNYNYADSLGDGLCATFFAVSKGESYSEQIFIAKEQPEKKLELSWHTFRNMLTPGEKEEWTLRVMKNNKKVNASVMATLYDASLDKFAPLAWYMRVYFIRNIPFSQWWTEYCYPLNFYKDKKMKLLSVNEMNFNKIDESLFSLSRSQRFMPMEVTVMQSSSVAKSNTPDNSAAYMDSKETATLKTKKSTAFEPEARSFAGATAKEEKILRTDFSETAFFFPSLRTDSKGEVRIAFTLPESLTSWNFKAIAHTQNLDYGMLNETIVARKTFSVTLNLPRFLRPDDQTTIMATLRSVESKASSGKAKLTVLDAETEAVLFSETVKFNIKASGEQTLPFSFKAKDSNKLLVCRIEAEGNGFSDGEQRYLAVLPEGETITRSMPFVIEPKGKTVIPLNKLYGKWNNKRSERTLTLERVDKPELLALGALPCLVEPKDFDALSYSIAYFATIVANETSRSFPMLRDRIISHADSCSRLNTPSALSRNEDITNLVAAETPWDEDSYKEAERTMLLARLFTEETNENLGYTYLGALQGMQRPSGAWSWYKGMGDSYSITLKITELLTRLQTLCPENSPSIAALSNRAMEYLDSTMRKSVNGYKKDERTSPTDEQELTYLYIHAMRKSSTTKEREYLIDKINGNAPSLTLRGKALAAIVLNKAGKRKEAKAVLKSLLEYTVHTPEMGSYFDSRRASFSHDCYKIPTQVAAIEAVREVTPEDTATVGRMTQWLIQSKRTQLWGSNVNAAMAVFSLLSSSDLGAAHTEASPVLFIIDKHGKRTRIMPQKSSSPLYFGYAMRINGETAPQYLEIENSDNSTPWGAAYITYEEKQNAIAPAAEGLSIETEYEVYRNGNWTKVAKDSVLRVGDAIRCIYSVSAARDLDFVRLRVPRPACLEPERQVSGISWENLTFYRAIGDASTSYFFDKFPKGHYRFSERMRVDRDGRFSTGIATIECVYAPEFRGNGSSAEINSTNIKK